MKGTSTAGVGELANFAVGCAFVVPAGIVYKMMKSRKGALIGCVTGTLVMIVLGCVINAYVLLPFYANAFEMPIDALIAMGTAVNPAINSLLTFVMLAVAPFNLLKGVLVSLITFLLYKRISRLVKGAKNGL
jgi:riboflavin transporter FmnP